MADSDEKAGVKEPGVPGSRWRRALGWMATGAGAGALLGYVLAWSGVTGPLDGAWNDWLQSMPGTAHPAASPLVHVAVRDLGDEGWPLSRLDVTLVVHAVNRHRPKVLAMELPLHGGDTFFPSYDAQLGGLLDRSGLVTLAVGLTGEPERETWDDWAAPVLPEGVVESAARFPGLLPPLPVFRSNASPGGGILLPDRGGVVRRVPLFFRVGRDWMPSFPLQVVAQYWGVHWPATRRSANGRLILAGPDGKALAELPVDGAGMVPVRLDPLPPGQEVEFRTAILASEQMITDEVPVFNLGLAQGKIVLLSRAHPEAGPVYRTAFGPLPIGDIQARMIHALLAGAFLREIPGWLTLLAFLGAGVLGAGVGSLQNFWVSAAVLIVMGTILGAVSFVSLDAGGWLVPWVSLALSILGSWALVRVTLRPVDRE